MKKVSSLSQVDKWLKFFYKIYRIFNYAESLNERVEVENELWKMARGKKPLPDKDKCRELAFKLGVPKKYRD